MGEKVNLSDLCLPPEKGIDHLLSEDATIGEALLRLCLQPERFTDLELKCLWEICADIHGFSLGTFITFVDTHFIKEVCNEEGNRLADMREGTNKAFNQVAQK